MTETTVLTDHSTVAAANFPRFVLEPLQSATGIDPIVLRTGSVSIGTAGDCELPINMPGIAPRHTTIVTEGKRTIIRSEDSRTWLNDGPVKEAQLRAGDRLAIGPIEFRIRQASNAEIAEANGINQNSEAEAWIVAAAASHAPSPRRTVAGTSDPIGIKAAFRRAIAEGILPASAADLFAERITDAPPATSPPTESAKPAASNDTDAEKPRATGDTQSDVVRRLDDIQKEIGRQQEQLTELLDPTNSPVEPQVNWLQEARTAAEQIADAGRKESLLKELLASLQEHSHELLERERDGDARLKRQTEDVSQLRNDVELEATRFRETRQRQQQELDDKQQQIESARAELDRLTTRFESQAAALETRQRELANRETEISALKSDVEVDRIARDEEWNQLRIEQKTLTADFAVLESRRSSLATAERDLEHELSEIYRERETLRQKIAAESLDRERAVDLEEQLGERDGEIARLGIQLQSVRANINAKIEQTDTRGAELQRECDDLKRHCRKLEVQIAQSASFETDLARRQSEIAGREAELAEERRRNDLAREELEGMRADLDRRHAAILTETNRQQERIDELQTRNRQVSIREDECEIEVQRIRDETAQLEESRAEIQARQLTFEEHRRSNGLDESSLENERSQLESRKSKYDEWQARLERQSEKIKNTKAEISAERESLDAQRSVLKSDREILESDRSKLQAELKRLSREREQFADDERAIQAERETLHAQRCATETEQKSLRELQDELERQRLNVEESRRTLEDDLEHIVQRETEVEQARADFERMRDEGQVQAETRDREWEARRLSSQESIDSEKTRLADERQRITEREAELLVQRAEVERLREELQKREADTNSTLTEQQQELHSRQTELATEEERLTTERERLAEQIAEMERSRDELELLREELQKREADTNSTLTEQQQELKSRKNAFEAEEQRLADERHDLAEQKAELESERNEIQRLRDDASQDTGEDDVTLAKRQDELQQRQATVAAEEARLADERRKLDEQKAELDSEREELNQLRESFRQQGEERELALQEHKHALREQRETLDSERDEYEQARAELVAAQRKLECDQDWLDRRTAELDLAESDEETPAADSIPDIVAEVESDTNDEDSAPDVRSLLSELFDMPDAPKSPGESQETPATEEVDDLNVDATDEAGASDVRERQESPVVELESMKWLNQSHEAKQQSDPQPVESTNVKPEDEPEDVYEVEVDEHSDTIAAYMEQLLARNKKGGVAPGSARSREKSAPKTTAEVGPLEQGPDEPESVVPGSAEDTPAVEVPPMPLLSSKPRVATDKAAVRADMSSMRELANMSARKAIAVHTWKRLRVKVLVKSVIFVISLVASIVLLTSGLWLPVSNTSYGLVALAIAAVMGFEVVRSKALFDSMNGGQREPVLGTEEEEATAADAEDLTAPESIVENKNEGVEVDAVEVETPLADADDAAVAMVGDDVVAADAENRAVAINTDEKSAEISPGSIST